MKLINNGLIKFDYQFPLYNFFFPAQSSNIFAPDRKRLSSLLARASEKANSRALYFHIPFCEEICSFCPFTRGLYKSDEEIDRYTQAIINEIEYKSKIIDYRSVPIRAIFFGGGTPSLLSPKNITDISEALHRHFDMSGVEEFSFEFNITSVTPERVAALVEAGMTHARFGLQTVDATWRKLFNLNADIRKIDTAAHLLTSQVKHVLCDIIYGMNGSTEDQTLLDIDKAVSLGVSNIDIYPINNAATSVKLHKKIKETFKDVMPAIRKQNMKLMIDEHLRQKGFMPYNGHGYVSHSNPNNELITRDYSFVYHEHVYGYDDHDVLGFGTGAISSMAENVITNSTSRAQYMKSMLQDEYVCHVSSHPPLLDTVKPWILRLPYHGHLEKSKVDRSKLPDGLSKKINALIDAKLIQETANTLTVTRQGWLWYSNMMFYLMPEGEQEILKKIVHEKLNVPGRDILQNEIIYPSA
ncbi:radical SAM protein [Pseudomonas sp. zfem002]|uniref:radical SAM protein n=1 Tax=Pseudomonas sp. zfem002 TaxID=3078197 RepID=UPI0029293A54|nr:radical SAM protein [Pseudomonas sp. zfem002]MDU9393403.1 radical SAM protein [Pseudomonas sp. zfem002]